MMGQRLEDVRRTRDDADAGAVDAPLEDGDRLVLYSDGLFQFFDQSFEEFSRRAQTLGGVPTDRLLESLLPLPAAVIDDDVTIFAVEIGREAENTP
jgi:hypothetical protein